VYSDLIYELELKMVLSIVLVVPQFLFHLFLDPPSVLKIAPGYGS
jgi:hypothetical protein